MSTAKWLDVGGQQVELLLAIDDALPVRILAFGMRGMSSPVAPRALVEVFTAAEIRPRSSGNYDFSSVGGRLRYQSHTVSEATGDVEVCIVQNDDVTGLRVEAHLRISQERATLRQHILVANDGASPVRIAAVPSLTLALAPAAGMLFTGRSEWAAEGRWDRQQIDHAVPDAGLGELGQRSRGRFARTSTGSWSTGEHLPMGVIVTDAGWSAGWQVESSGGWHWELTRGVEALFLTASGATDVEHQASVLLAPEEEFVTESGAFALVEGGLDQVAAALTHARRDVRSTNQLPPIVYNDFLNTLNADPTTATVLPLVDAAADAGVECYCLDAGWYSDDDDWWDLVGDWVPSRRRFPDGLREVFDRVAARGLRAGIWLEPEVVGIRSRAAAELPDDAFFTRDGIRVVEHGRYQLDFRSASARSHIDGVVDRLISEFHLTYLKLDYNISMAPGTTGRDDAAGAGLRGHARAYRSWLRSLRTTYPDLTIENCASGAMRADYALLSESDLQSTSDQVNGLRYSSIAAAAPLSILPEQCANWAVPAEGMTPESVKFALTAGLMGNFYLGGRLDRLSLSSREVLREAVELARKLRGFIARSVPSWPLGLPGDGDEVTCLALTADDRTLVALWSTSTRARDVHLPTTASAAHVLLSGVASVVVSETGMLVRLPAGPTATIIDIKNYYR